jgi:hypothetical protein
MHEPRQIICPRSMGHATHPVSAGSAVLCVPHNGQRYLPVGSTVFPGTYAGIAFTEGISVWAEGDNSLGDRIDHSFEATTNDRDQPPAGRLGRATVEHTSDVIQGLNSNRGRSRVQQAANRVIRRSKRGPVERRRPAGSRPSAARSSRAPGVRRAHGSRRRPRPRGVSPCGAARTYVTGP